jgi:hypothetical protein
VERFKSIRIASPQSSSDKGTRITRALSAGQDVNYQKMRRAPASWKRYAVEVPGSGRCSMDPTKVAQMVEVLNGLTAREALCLLVDCTLTVLDEAPSDEERQQSLDGCLDLPRCTKDRL